MCVSVCVCVCVWVCIGRRILYRWSPRGWWMSCCVVCVCHRPALSHGWVAPLLQTCLRSEREPLSRRSAHYPEPSHSDRPRHAAAATSGSGRPPHVQQGAAEHSQPTGENLHSYSVNALQLRNFNALH